MKRFSSTWAQFVPFVVIVVLGYGLVRERSAVRGLASVRVELSNEVKQLRLELVHLRHFHRSSIPPPEAGFISGFDVTGDTVIDLDRFEDGIYYSLATSCPACPVNFPALQELYQTSAPTFRVFGLSLIDSVATLQRYVDDHDITFPVIAHPNGGLKALMPRAGTPFALVFSEGCLVATAAGAFTPEKLELMHFFAEQRRPDGFDPGSSLRPIDEC